LLFESNKSTRQWGNKIAKTTPGTPFPLPTSIARSGFWANSGSINPAIVTASFICLSQKVSRSLADVK